MAPLVGEDQRVLAHYHQMNAETIFVRLPDGRIVPAAGTHPYIKDLRGKTVADLKFREVGIAAKAADTEQRRIRTAGFVSAEERVEAAIALTDMALKSAAKSSKSHPLQPPKPVLLPIAVPAQPAVPAIPAQFEVDLID